MNWVSLPASDVIFAIEFTQIIAARTLAETHSDTATVAKITMKITVTSAQARRANDD